MEKAVMLMFLGIAAAEDLQKKELPAALLWIFGAGGVVFQLWNWAARGAFGGQMAWMAGGMAGVLLAGIGKLTGEAIGYGDAWAVGVLGVWLGIFPAAESFFLGLSLTAVYAGWLFCVRRKGGKYRIAFLPFLLTGYLAWLIFMGEAAG